jgi:hypothetical protein
LYDIGWKKTKKESKMICYGWRWGREYVIKKLSEKEPKYLSQIEKLRKNEYGKCGTCLYNEDCNWGARR